MNVDPDLRRYRDCFSPSGEAYQPQTQQSIYTDGTALPSSFGEVRDLYVHQATDPALSPDLEARNQQHHAKIVGSNPTPPNAQSNASPSGLRNDIETRRDAIRKEANAVNSSFDRKAEMIDTGDGTLATRKSLLTESGKQVFEDGQARVDTAKEAVKQLLQKDR